MVYNNILEAIGNTPLIRLNKMAEECCGQILVKYEGVNVGGSIKTRTAFNMLAQAEAKGLIGPGSVIVEPTSGNQGIGLALVGAVKGYRTIIVVPDSVSAERSKILRNYGAEVVVVKDNGNIGECIAECLRTALEVAASIPGAFVPQQFTNPDNPDIHIRTTAVEIIEQAGVKIDGFCSGIGTGGTISGIGKVLKEANSDISIWALEPTEAAILSGGRIGSHVQTGIGDGLIPENLNTNIYNKVITISDEEALRTAKDLARLEGILCGVSSGTNVAGALRLARELGPGKTVVTVLPDTGERYFSTSLFE